MAQQQQQQQLQWWFQGASPNENKESDTHRLYVEDVPTREAATAIIGVVNDAIFDISHLEPASTDPLYYSPEYFSCVYSYFITYDETDQSIQGLILVGRAPGIKQGLKGQGLNGKRSQLTMLGSTRQESATKTKARSLYDNIINRFPTNNNNNPRNLPLQEDINMSINPYASGCDLLKHHLKQERNILMNSSLPLSTVKSLSMLRSELFVLNGGENYFENYRGTNSCGEAEVSIFFYIHIILLLLYFVLYPHCFA